jgi:hypothetical protein
MDEHEVPFFGAGAGVADDRLCREIGLGVKVIYPDGLEMEAAQLRPDAAKTPGELPERAEQSTGIDHRGDVAALLLDDVGDGFMAFR